MNDRSKIFAVIRSLEEKEVKELRKLLRSPFFTRRVRLKSLFDELIKILKKGKGAVEMESLFYRIFPNDPYNYPRLRSVLSDLQELIEAYWVSCTYHRDKLEGQLIINSIYRERNLEKSYSSSIKKTAQSLDQFPQRNVEYYQHLLDFQTERMKYLSSTKNTSSIFLQEMSDTEDILYLTKKLRTACAQLSHQLVQKTTYNIGLLSNLLSEINQEKYISIPTIAIYYYCFRFLTESGSSEHFQAFKSQLDNFRHHFNNEDLSAPYRLAINYCIRSANDGDPSYFRELWQLYKSGLKEGILLENKFIPHFTFNNAITAGLRVKEFNWVAHFITTYAEKLESRFREQTVIFNLAKLAYEQQQYQKALQHLRQANFKEIRINVVGKIMLTKIYYELQSYESLEAHLENFQQFIRRKEVSDFHRKNILNLVRFVKKINALQVFNKNEKEKLRRQIINEEILSEREWLLSKL